MPLKPNSGKFGYKSEGIRDGRNVGVEGGPQKNNHPTIKPISLMKYIIKLLAPPGNPILLDPFCGSGSTLLAAQQLGINFIGIEKEKEYCEIAEQRIKHGQSIQEAN